MFKKGLKKQVTNKKSEIYGSIVSHKGELFWTCHRKGGIFFL